jgi:hemin uptake protein HemP
VVESESGDGSTPHGTPTRGRIIDSQTLLRGNSEIAIEHFGQVYRLRVTATGKLILTK